MIIFSPLACVDHFFFPIWASTYYNPGQNVLGHLTKLGTKTHFAKLTHILPLKTAWGWCYKGLFLLSPSPPSSVDCVELKLEYITSTLHRGGRGEGRCLNLTSYCVSVPRVLTRVVDPPSLTVLGTPRVKSVYRITLSKGTVFVLALTLRQLLRACKIKLKYKVFLNKNRARLFFFFILERSFFFKTTYHKHKTRLSRRSRQLLCHHCHRCQLPLQMSPVIKENNSDNLDTAG